MVDSAMRNRSLEQLVRRKIPRLLSGYLPYLILGGVVFWGNSNLELPYFLRGYLTLLEAQLGLALLYFLVFKRHKSTSVEKYHEK
jgi:hypothetical protein